MLDGCMSAAVVRRLPRHNSRALLGLLSAAACTARVLATTANACPNDPINLRLVGGNGYGRLEVQYCGVWGTVCDDNFDDNDARVACRHLGYGNGDASQFFSDTTGSGQIWLDDMGCTGSEWRLEHCNHNGWGNHNCAHNEDVSLRCVAATTTSTTDTTTTATTTTTCEPTMIRLTNGDSGRLEVSRCGTWGTVCDDSFTQVDARVVCRELGYSEDGALVVQPQIPGSGPIWLDDVGCTGSETRLQDCSHRGWGDHNCGHYEDVSLTCVATTVTSTTTCAPTIIRLINGNSGRLEVRYCGTWGTVCDDAFGPEDASVVCRELGMADAEAQVYGPGSGSGQIWLDDLSCTGSESRLSDCSHNGWGQHNCVHSKDVGVRCLYPATTTVPTTTMPTTTVPTTTTIGCQYGGVRLENGESGRLEVNYCNLWRSVCDDAFTSTDAGVVCNELGLTGGTVTSAVAGSQGFWLDNVACSGSESSIAECSHNGWGIHNCGSSEHVGVSCNNPTLTARGGLCELRGMEGLRLSGGSSGRVEVNYCGDWGTVCDDGFGEEDAMVVCKTLGYAIGTKITNEPGSGTIWMRYLACTGTETRLADCMHGGFQNYLTGGQCSHSEDVAVECMQTTVRLSGGTEGRLEVFYEGEWGTVCDDSFDDNDNAAMVVCRQLGYSSGTLMTDLYNTGSADESTRPARGFWLDDVQCTGNEAALEDCEHGSWGSHNCVTREDVGVACSSPLPMALIIGICAGSAVFLGLVGWFFLFGRQMFGKSTRVLPAPAPSPAPLPQPVIVAATAVTVSVHKADEVVPARIKQEPVIIANDGPAFPDAPWSLSKVEDADVLALLQQLLEPAPENRATLGVGRDAGHYHKKYTRLQLEGAWEVDMGIKKSFYEVKLQELQMLFPQIEDSDTTVYRTEPTPTLCDEVGKQLNMNNRLNEKLLLHGTKVKNVEVILNNGLDERYTTVGAFGYGAYLAEDPSKTDQYVEADTMEDTSVEAIRLHQELYGGGCHPGEVFYVFICRVLLGCPIYTNGLPNNNPLSIDGPTASCPAGLEVFANSRHNQLRDIPGTVPSMPYHSLVVEKGSRSAVKRHREFVIFDARTQVLPKYLIAYSRR